MPSPIISTGDAAPVGVRLPTASRPMGLRAYRALTHLLRPAAPLILRYRERNGKEDPARRGERLGVASSPRPPGALVWLHAASVGETSSILPLIADMAGRRPQLNFLLTTGTVTSGRLAARRIGPRTMHQYVPLDSPPFVARFLDHWRPSIGVFAEQEIWPNLVLEASQRHVRLALVNARMSERSFERWRGRPEMAAALFAPFDAVLAQNDELAQRFRTLGALRVTAAGNLKVDAPPPPVDPAAFAALTAALGARLRMVAASTHEGEEIAVGEAHLRLAGKLGRLVTIIAPRHPERGAAVAEAMTALGLKACRRSGGALPAADTDIYVADTIGELGTLYAASPVSFVGGSLIPHGGQNPIEAVRHGSVVVTGPSGHNFADAYAALLAEDAAVRVANAGELATALGALLGDASRVAAMRRNGARALATLSGALEQTSTVLLSLLPEDVPLAPGATGDHGRAG